MSECASNRALTRHGRFTLPRRTRVGTGRSDGAQLWIEAGYIPSGTADLWRSARGGARR